MTIKTSRRRRPSPGTDYSGRGTCSLCGRQAEPPRLWCIICLVPYMKAGQEFQPHITVIRRPAPVEALA